MQATVECGFTLKRVRDMTRTYSQMHRTDFAPASSKEFLDIQATIDSGFTLKRASDLTRTYSQMYGTDMYSEHR